MSFEKFLSITELVFLYCYRLYDTDLISITAQAPPFLRKAYRIGVQLRQSLSKSSMDQLQQPQVLAGGPPAASAVPGASSLATADTLGPTGSREGAEAQLDSQVPPNKHEGVVA
jgi:hypothetical protein